MDLNTAPVTELAYVSALEAEFWEFDSPLGHHQISPFHLGSSTGRASVSKTEG